MQCNQTWYTQKRIQRDTTQYNTLDMTQHIQIKSNQIKSDQIKSNVIKHKDNNTCFSCGKPASQIINLRVPVLDFIYSIL